MGESVSGWIGGWVDQWVGESVGGWISGSVGGWISRWVGTYEHVYIGGWQVGKVTHSTIVMYGAHTSPIAHDLKNCVELGTRLFVPLFLNQPNTHTWLGNVV